LGCVVIEFTLETDEQGTVLLSEIRANSMASEPWMKMVDQEQLQGTRLLSELVTGMTGAELRSAGSLSVVPYWEAMRRSSLMAYIVYHGKNGAIIESASFDQSVAKFDPGLWQRSSTALAFLTQEISYNNRPVIDLVNPIYLDDTWKGAVRIGVNRY
jgi:hypothetical protein